MIGERIAFRTTSRGAGNHAKEGVVVALIPAGKVGDSYLPNNRVPLTHRHSLGPVNVDRWLVEVEIRGRRHYYAPAVGDRTAGRSNWGPMIVSAKSVMVNGSH